MPLGLRKKCTIFSEVKPLWGKSSESSCKMPTILLQDGKTDYKSVTVASNATAEEFIDFYFDDIVRMKWVSHPTKLSGTGRMLLLHPLN